MEKLTTEQKIRILKQVRYLLIGHLHEHSFKITLCLSIHKMVPTMYINEIENQFELLQYKPGTSPKDIWWDFNLPGVKKRISVVEQLITYFNNKN